MSHSVWFAVQQFLASSQKLVLLCFGDILRTCDLAFDGLLVVASCHFSEEPTTMVFSPQASFRKPVTSQFPPSFCKPCGAFAVRSKPQSLARKLPSFACTTGTLLQHKALEVHQSVVYCQASVNLSSAPLWVLNCCLGQVQPPRHMATIHAVTMYEYCRPTTKVTTSGAGTETGSSISRRLC